MSENEWVVPDPLVDRFGRVHRSLRVSVTDRCNLRCTYCMPAVHPEFVQRDKLLSYEEIDRVVGVLSERCGIRQLRITGGEPLVRRDLPTLLRLLSNRQTVTDFAMTTNAIALTPNMARDLVGAGLNRINISLDTLHPERFKQVTRRDALEATLRGIAVANEHFETVKLNALAISGLDESEIFSLTEFALQHGMPLRFIEFMPLDADESWQRSAVVDGETILATLRRRYPDLRQVPRTRSSEPAETFAIGDGTVGIIRSVSQPFCGSCDRLRLTADGSLRNCLFAHDETPLRQMLRDGCSDDAIVHHAMSCVAAKKRSHGMDEESFRPPQRPMYAIGG